YTTGLPDTARYTLDFDQTTTIAGPIDLTLYATTTSADVDFWAEILDRDTATGDTTFVQRGLLRASFNGTFDPAKSQRTPCTARASRRRASPSTAHTCIGDIYRPYYAYDHLTPVIPGQANKYDLELFPLGHAWRAGHQ